MFLASIENLSRCFFLNVAWHLAENLLSFVSDIWVGHVLQSRIALFVLKLGVQNIEEQYSEMVADVLSDEKKGHGGQKAGVELQSLKFEFFVFC